MGMGFTYQGVSGELYHFLMVDMRNPKALPWHGGLFVFATYTPDPLYFGEGASLFESMTSSPQWAKAEEDAHGITVAYLLLEDDSRKRAAILADLLANHAAPLNRAQ